MPLCGTKKSKKRDPSPPYGERVERVTEANLQLKKEADDQREKVNKLKADLDGIRKDREKWRTEAGRLGNDVKDLQDKLAVLEAKLAGESGDSRRNVDEMIKEYEGKLKQITKEVEEEKKKRENTDSEKKKIEAEVKDIKKHLETEKTQRVKAERDKAQYQKEKEQVERELTATKQNLQEFAQKETSSPNSPVSDLTQEWQTKIDQVEAERQKEQDLRQQTEHDVTRLTSDHESLKVEMDLLKTANDESVSDLKKNLENSTVSHRYEVHHLKSTISDFEHTAKEEAETRDKLLTRLSAMTASALMDGNPNVSDLSDPNRPEKLREQMSELYDNQWTDASDELEKLGKTEQEIIDTLSAVLVDIYDHCKESSEDQLARVEEDMFLPPMENPPSPGTNGTEPVKSPTKSHSVSKIPRFGSHKARPTLFTSEKKDQGDGNEPPKEGKAKRSRPYTRAKGDTVLEVPQEVRKGIKDYRKRVAKQVIPVVEKEIINKLRAKPQLGDQVVDACIDYISKCVSMCWYMRVQDPPVSLSWVTPSDKKFDLDSYKAFTKNGSHIEFVVWPIMYLCDEGPVMCKGIAQGINL